jgi:hypothetical protein
MDYVPTCVRENRYWYNTYRALHNVSKIYRKYSLYPF